MALVCPVYAVQRSRGIRGHRRCYGYFRCEKCDHPWESAWAWDGWGQKCRRCTDREDWGEVSYTYPEDLRPLLGRQELENKYRSEGRDWDSNRRRRNPINDHYYQNCEYCAELCGSTARVPTHAACKHRVP